ncbi:hypothetical protein Rmet_6770 (plasmid) [Cupriavidus metallidurans CH34]|uniref:Uncharacterized protein n=1 Tax=Cupriavidus metallidurans (strain ATCC 43123 / DSM 2839 / NBRC 102507 / CH34) TaxID=266264 RepID=D3DYH7_CUPMC|nr:hypothetical protein Rmet_6770 [Cupriavidus metallidurans CH34]
MRGRRLWRGCLRQPIPQRAAQLLTGRFLTRAGDWSLLFVARGSTPVYVLRPPAGTFFSEGGSHPCTLESLPPSRWPCSRALRRRPWQATTHTSTGPTT